MNVDILDPAQMMIQKIQSIRRDLNVLEVALLYRFPLAQDYERIEDLEAQANECAQWTKEHCPGSMRQVAGKLYAEERPRYGSDQELLKHHENESCYDELVKLVEQFKKDGLN